MKNETWNKYVVPTIEAIIIIGFLALVIGMAALCDNLYVNLF